MFNLFGFGKSRSEDLKKLIAEGATLLDVRTRAEFAGGSAKGAINIPLDELSKNIKRLEGKISILVFCRSGARSAQAKNFLESIGFSDVVNGGSWQDVASLQ